MAVTLYRNKPLTTPISIHAGMQKLVEAKIGDQDLVTGMTAQIRIREDGKVAHHITETAAIDIANDKISYNLSDLETGVPGRYRLHFHLFDSTGALIAKYPSHKGWGLEITGITHEDANTRLAAAEAAAVAADEARDQAIAAAKTAEMGVVVGFFNDFSDLPKLPTVVADNAREYVWTGVAWQLYEYDLATDAWAAIGGLIGSELGATQITSTAGFATAPLTAAYVDLDAGTQSGRFRYNPTVTVPDGGIYFAASDGKVWERIYGGVVNFKFYAPDLTGVADTSVKLQAALDVGAGAVVVSQPGDYRINSMVTVSNDTEIDMKSGTELVYYGTSVGLRINGPDPPNESTHHVHHIRISRGTVEWFNGGADTSSRGVQVRNTDWNHFHITFIKNFYIGLEILGDGVAGATGAVSNTFFIDLIRNNKKGIVFSSLNSGWANQNTFIGGAINITSSYATPTEVGSRGIEAIATGNNSSFFNVNMEGDSWEKTFHIDVPYMSFYECRFEQAGAGGLKVGPNAKYGRAVGGYDNWGPEGLEWDIDPASEFQVIGARGADFYSTNDGTAFSGGAGINYRCLSSGATIGPRVWNFDDTIRAECNGGGDYSFWSAPGKLTTENPGGQAFPRLTISASGGRIKIGDGTAAPVDMYVVVGGGDTVRFIKTQLQEMVQSIFADNAAAAALATNFLYVTNEGLVRVKRASAEMIFTEVVFKLPNLPTTNPGGSGQVWNNAGVLNIT